jgi:hypothetical protein
MLVFTIAITTPTGITFGVFPALAAGRVQHALKQRGRTYGRRQRRLAA